MTPDLMRALAISGGILVGVVILIVIVTMENFLDQNGFIRALEEAVMPS